MNKTQATITIMKILGNPNRLAILSILATKSKGLCVGEIAKKVDISQSLASHQLAYLEVRGIVKGARSGQTTCYALTSSLLAKKIISVLKLFK